MKEPPFLLEGKSHESAEKFHDCGRQVPLTASMTGAYILQREKSDFVTPPPWPAEADAGVPAVQEAPYESLGANEKEDVKWEQFYLSFC